MPCCHDCTIASTNAASCASTPARSGATGRPFFVTFHDSRHEANFANSARAAALESWNVTKGGEPVAPDLEGVLAQDAAFVTAIVQSWQQGMAQAPPPLPGGSRSGGSSAAESTLGLASSSASLPSS